MADAYAYIPHGEVRLEDGKIVFDLKEKCVSFTPEEVEELQKTLSWLLSYAKWRLGHPIDNGGYR